MNRRTMHTPRRALTIAATALALALSGCARIKARLGMDSAPAPLPGPPPTAEAFGGIDRVLRAPGAADGPLERIAYPDSDAGRRIPAGDSALVLDAAGPGIVRRFRLDLRSADPDWLRGIVIRMYWDDEVDPSVDVPLGDFFGNPFDRRPYASLPMGVSGGGFYSYLALPFGRHARIAIVNETGVPVEDLSFEAEVAPGTGLADPVATFHAAWSREARPRAGRRHLVADLAGTGWLVGTTLAAQGYAGSFSFLAGDERLTVDGRAVRGATLGSALAEGPERGAPLAGPFQGTVLRDDARGRIAAYRWRLPDPIPFHQSLRLELERGPADSEAADYATVAYWYQVEPHRPSSPLPYASERRVADVILPVGAIWRDDLEMFGTGIGTMALSVRAPRPDRYELVVFPEASPGSPLQSVRVRLPGHVARPVPAGDPGAEAGDVLPGVVLDTVAVTGRSVELEVAARGGIALPAAVWLRPLPRWADAWWVLGPWPGAAPLDSAWAPELDPDTLQTYRVPGRGLIAWDSLYAGEDGSVSLAGRFDDEGPATQPWTGYAQTWVRAPAGGLTPLLLGARGPFQVWVNGQKVAERRVSSPTGFPEIEVDAPLRTGWNRVLLKVPDDGREWSFRLRAADPAAVLRWARSPDGA